MNAAPQTFDAAAFAALGGGEPARLRRLSATFSTSLAQTIPALIEAMHARDLPRVQALGHRLKSAASWAGAYALSTLGAELEGFEVPASDAAISERCVVLQRTAQATLDALAASLATPQSPI